MSGVVRPRVRPSARLRFGRAAPLAITAPIAIFAGACSLRPWTPSVSVAFFAEETPGEKAYQLPSAEVAAARWQLPTSVPWSRYAKLTLFSALGSSPSPNSSTMAELPDVTQLEVVKSTDAAAANVAKLGVPDDVMWVVDLRGAASVSFGAALSQRAAEPIAPVVTFNNWPAENELVPAEETLAALISTSPRLLDAGGPIARARPVFLLDAWRLAYRFDEPDDDVVDNRYVLGGADLPSVEVLRSQGISRMIYVVEDLDDTSLEEDDLHATFAAYAQGGIALYLVDLRWLAETTSLAPAASDLESHALAIDPRVTLLDDPSFYARAHGGFGGIHATPVRFGVHWGVGHAWGGGGWGGGGFGG